jgi:hypothetical protein
MTDPRRIAALARLAAIRKEADLAALAAANRQVRAIETRIAALDDALAAARQAAVAGADPATLVAQDAFGRWSGGKRLLLTERLREADRLAEAHRGTARHSFGRAKVLERLTEAAVAEARLRKARS